MKLLNEGPNNKSIEILAKRYIADMKKKINEKIMYSRFYT